MSTYDCKISSHMSFALILVMSFLEVWYKKDFA
jgi:hypothetical protein